MESFKISHLILFAGFWMGSLAAVENPPDISPKGHILYAMQSNNPSKGFELYKQRYQATHEHDFELLEQMILMLLDQGFRSNDLETETLTLFGAGISTNEKLLYILEDGITDPNPQIQLISLNFLSRYQNDEADEALNRGMSSNYLPIRLEIAHQLAQKKYPTAVGQTEALMHKVDKQFWFVFPQLFALIGDPHAIKILRKLMNDPDDQVRIESIISAAKYGRDDLLPQIRNLSTHLNIGQQEACAAALGVMKDEASVDKLQRLCESTTLNVRLAAWLSLYHLGRKETKEPLEAAAKSLDLFAITALGEIEGSEELLFKLTQHPDLQIRTNASLALLERNDPRCLKSLCEILIRDSRDLAFIKSSSLGRALAAWKAVPSAQQNFKDTPYLYELSITMREAALTKALEFPEKDFLALANLLFEKQQNDLIPILVHLVENLHTPAAIDLLKKHQQKIGAPLVRNYCNLGLYRLKEEGPYGDNLRQWVARQQHIEMIQFRALIPWEMRSDDSTYQLTPKETSQLLIESVEALAAAQDDASIEALFDAISNGNSKNKYALAGLLLRAIQ